MANFKYSSDVIGRDSVDLCVATSNGAGMFARLLEAS